MCWVNLVTSINLDSSSSFVSTNFVCLPWVVNWMGTNQSTILNNRRQNNVNDKSTKNQSSPDQIKFLPVQLMKLKVIQGSFGFESNFVEFEDCSDTNSTISISNSNGNMANIRSNTLNTNAHANTNHSNPKTPNTTTTTTNNSFNSDEAFMSTISTLIAALNLSNEHEPEKVLEIIKLFTSVFIKNMNLIRVSELFEFSIENRKIVEHLLKAYIKAIISVQQDEVKNEILRSLLILCSSKIPFKNEDEIKIIRYFHINLLKILSDDADDNSRSDNVANLFCDALIENIKLIPIKSNSLFFNTTITTSSTSNNNISSSNSNNCILSDRSKISIQILLILFLYDETGNTFVGETTTLNLHCTALSLSHLTDSKMFTIFMKIHAHNFFSSTSTSTSVFNSNHFNSNSQLTNVTVLILFQSLLLNFCQNYRRFLLSKLDNDDYLLSTCRAMYQLMKSSSNRRALILTDLYLLAQTLLSLTEDETFIQQIFDTDLDKSKIKWFEGWNEFGASITNLGPFIFCLLLDLLGANLASKDGFKDEHLHQLLIGILCNMAQYAKFIDNKLLSERFFALLHLLFRQQLPQPDTNAALMNDSVNRCIVDVLSVITNILINSPKTNSFLISQLISDAPRLLPFLRNYLHWIDSKTNSKLSAHLREDELEFTAVIVGILKFLEKLQRYLEQRPFNGSLQVLESILETFPVPTIKRDSRGEAQRLGLRIKLDGPINFKDWSKFCSIQGWPIIYSTISWNNFVD